MRRPNVISLFAGCGGLDLGFKQAGYHIAWANEIDPEACATYIKNIGDHVYQDDIRNVTRSLLPADIDIVIGGFPCQGFSMAGKRDLNDERNFLYLEMKRIIGLTRPKVFLAENVRGLLSMDKGLVLKQILKEFSELGYNVQYKLLFAPEFGVPQERYRVFIVGIREDISHDYQFPESTHTEYINVRDSIGDIMELGGLVNHEITQSWPDYYSMIIERIGEGQKLCNSRHSDSSVYTWNIPEVYGETTSEEKELLVALAKNRRRKEYGPKDGNPLSAEILSYLTGFPLEKVHILVRDLLSKEYLVEKNNKYDITKASFSRFKRILWDKPSPTILTNFDNPRNYLHPSEPRPITVREAARLQSFPDDFEFLGKIQAQYRQVGNAVPPELAKAMALSLLPIFEGGIEIV